MSLSDSYREFELYLEQVSNEITRVFEDWNSSYGLEPHTTEIVSPTKTVLIEPANNLLKNSEWEDDACFAQSFNAVATSNIEELLTQYKVQHRICNKNYDTYDAALNNANNVSKNWKLETDEVTFKYAAYPQWPCGFHRNDIASDWFIKDSFVSPHFSLDAVELNLRETAAIDERLDVVSPPVMCKCSSNAGLSPKLPSSSDINFSHDGNGGCSKSVDELNTLSWLCWQRWQQDLSVSYSPVVPVVKKVTVKVDGWPCISNSDIPGEQTNLFAVGSTFSCLSVKVNDNWPVRKAEQLWRQMRAHKIAEIEAAEACKWLRAAGFPQYAQMYEEMQFPVDVVAAQHDHPLLEPAVLQSLFRRLHALNRCAHVCQQPCNHPDDSEDEQCALSDNWTYQSDLRRWSRTCQTEQTSSTETSKSKEKLYTDITCRDDKDSSDIAVMHREKQPLNKSASTDEHKLLRRAASTRFRHHREGVVVPDIGSLGSVSDILLKRLGSIRYVDEPPLADVENTTINPEKCDEEDAFNESATPANTPINDEDCTFSGNVQRIETVVEETSQVKQDLRPLASLSCTQLQILRKLALLKLTAHIEKYCPSHRTGWNWELPKFIKKMRTPMYKESLLLNLPLTSVLQRTGQPLPRGIQEALEWLRLNGADQVGLFRKPGVRSRIQSLKALVESQGENINFTDQQPYDVADMIKQYFRELPEAVLTNKLSETFILIFQYVPPFLRREAVLCTLLLMPDEHREVLQALLYFLLKIAKCSDVNQMNDNNLAICFAPSLFQYSSHSSFCRQGLGSPNPRELVEIKAAQECLLYMMRHSGDIFNVPRELLNQCKLSEINDSRAVQLSDLGSSADGGWQGYMQECHVALLKEVREKNRGWIMVSTTHPKIELSYKKVVDGHPLRLWKVCADVEAPPAEVLHRILRERHIWDDDLHSAKIIAQMNKHSEVFHFVRRNIAPLPYVDYCVIRTWNTDLPRGTCVIVETSVEHPDIPNIPNTVRGIILASRYLIEPGGSGRSRLLHLSRVDTRGRMPEWYHKNFGHLCAIHAAHIQSSFRQSTAGPESKV